MGPATRDRSPGCRGEGPPGVQHTRRSRLLSASCARPAAMSRPTCARLAVLAGDAFLLVTNSCNPYSKVSRPRARGAPPRINPHAAMLGHATGAGRRSWRILAGRRCHDRGRGVPGWASRDSRAAWPVLRVCLRHVLTTQGSVAMSADASGRGPRTGTLVLDSLGGIGP